MHASATLSAIAPLLLLVNAADVFDMKKIPSTCASICQPISTLVKACHVNDDAVGGKQNERTLEDNCICTNKSFDVAQVMPKCADCLSQAVGQARKRNDGLKASDLVDLNALVGRCGFSQSAYTAADGEAAAGIQVSATPLTDISQIGSQTGSTSNGGNQGPAPSASNGASSTGGGVRPPAIVTTRPGPTSGGAVGSAISLIGAAAVAAVWAAIMA